MRADVVHARRALRWSKGGGGPEELDDIGQVIDHRRSGAGDDVGWVNIRQDEVEGLSALAPRLHLDDQAVEDLAARRERPKLDVGPDVAVLITRGVEFDPTSGTLTSHPVSAVVSDGVLITVINDAAILAEFTKRVKRQRTTVTAGHLLYELLDELVDGYSDVEEQIADTVDAVAELVFDDHPLSRRDQRRAFQLRRSLTRLRRFVMPMVDIATTLTNAARSDPDTMKETSWMVGQLLPETARGFADIADHALHVAEGLDGLRDTMGGLMDTNLSLADVRLNTVMKKLASWAAVIAVPTFITGFMGMNVPYPGFDSVWGVIGSVSLIVASVSWLIWFFHKRDWL